ncbi:MAG: glycosyltransferase [Candidatus Aureabacteria bacterium]|nr:glycosyltransferase [Candidatus Auribacterota bacterium]
MTEIHQMLSGAVAGDAITNYALEIKEILQSTGIHSEIFCPYQHTAPELKKIILPASEHLPDILKKDPILLYHFSIGSEMTEYFIHAKGKRVLCYHNITPEKYFRFISDHRANVLQEGRKELARLKNITDIALAVSHFNAKEMEEIGYKNPQVIPLTLNKRYLETPPSRSIIHSYKDSFTNFLFVGRVSPNKKLEDILRVFYYYNKTINPSSRLLFVGSYTGMEKYYTYLRYQASEMGLQNVTFSGHVSLGDLLGYYAASTLFLCMSEHEGVCIPLIESMYFKKPVFALSRAAIPETLGDAGVLIQEKDYRAIAELIDVVLQNPGLLNNIVAKQSERVKDFHPNRLKEKLKTIFNI